MTTPQGMLELADECRAAFEDDMNLPRKNIALRKAHDALRQAAAPQGREANSALTKIAAECHRAKWQFDMSEDYKPKASVARGLVAKAFDDLHKIGDMALKLRDALTPAVAPDGAGWRTDMGNAPKDRPFLVYWHKSNIFGVLEWYNGHWEDQDGDEVFAFSRWCLFELPDDLPALAQAQEPGEERKSLVDPGEVDISALRPERSGARG